MRELLRHLRWQLAWAIYVYGYSRAIGQSRRIAWRRLKWQLFSQWYYDLYWQSRDRWPLWWTVGHHVPAILVDWRKMYDAQDQEEVAAIPKPAGYDRLVKPQIKVDNGKGES